MHRTTARVEVNGFSVFSGRQCATWPPGLEAGVHVQRLIAGGRTKTRQETTTIMPEINTTTASVTDD